MRRPFKIALYAIAALVGWLVLQSVLPRKVPQMPAVIVSFLGYTNGPPGMTLAVFGITNQASRSIKLLNGCTIDFEGRRVPLPSTTRFPETVLPPSGRLIAVIGISPGEERWRVREFRGILGGNAF